MILQGQPLYVLKQLPCIASICWTSLVPKIPAASRKGCLHPVHDLLLRLSDDAMQLSKYSFGKHHICGKDCFKGSLLMGKKGMTIRISGEYSQESPAPGIACFCVLQMSIAIKGLSRLDLSMIYQHSICTVMAQCLHVLPSPGLMGTT